MSTGSLSLHDSFDEVQPQPRYRDLIPRGRRDTTAQQMALSVRGDTWTMAVYAEANTIGRAIFFRPDFNPRLGRPFFPYFAQLKMLQHCVNADVRPTGGKSEFMCVVSSL